MKSSIKDLGRLILPMSNTQKRDIRTLEEYLGSENLNKATYLIRTRRVAVAYSKIGQNIIQKTYPQIVTKDSGEIGKFVKKINKKIHDKVFSESVKEISLNAESVFKSFISPNIFGLDTVKQAVALQLFSSERIHLLLLGDPGVGKTDIIRYAAKLSPISSFGLGSGTSGAGLGVMYKGDEQIMGLLPKADEGLCCIDELNLMKREDYASLYSAMEKGFITYDKGSKHVQLNARVRVLATANPKGDKFVGKTIPTLRKQLPFDSALLSRFHLVFLIRKPGVEGFLQITKKIVRNQKKVTSKQDRIFLNEYIDKAMGIEVDFPKKLEPEVVEFARHVKESESKFLVEISPRLVIGFMRLCQARARMHMRPNVIHEDLDKVKEIFIKSLFLREKDLEA